MNGGAPAATPPKKAGLGQVAATIFFGLVMVGRRNTWRREDGTTVSFAQVVVGAFVGLGVIVVLLGGLVFLATR